MRQAGVVTGLLAATVLCAATGCRFEKKRGGEDQPSDVKFATPFGGMSVKTDANTVQQGVGLSVYPGAVPVQKRGDGHGDGAADVNMSFGSFHLGVKALTYNTPDAPDKVLAFYRKDMTHYGSVILCRGPQAQGEPARTQDGLGCNNNDHTTIDLDRDHDEELKAGSRQHQHIVSVKPKGSGTEIGLVALDLPGNLGGGDEDNKQ